MNPEQFKNALATQGINLSETQLQQFERYYQLLVEWNEKINLTAITKKQDVYLKHFYDSITLGFYYDFTNPCKLVDVGSGAGFPSIPLKIVYPNLEIAIVDSLNKRVQFLDTVISDLELENITAYHGRAETFGQNPDFRGQFDFVTARAVARLNLLAEFCIPLLKKEGQFLAMKASKAETELAEAKNAIAVLGGKFIEDISFELPEIQDARHIIRVEKRKETPNKYPRKPGKPAKKPL